jgi:hypothetical protein
MDAMHVIHIIHKIQDSSILEKTTDQSIKSITFTSDTKNCHHNGIEWYAERGTTLANC